MNAPIRPLLIAAVVLVAALAGALPPPVFAGQDRFTYAPNGAPNPGYAAQWMRKLGTSNWWTLLRSGGLYQSADGGATWTASYSGINGSAPVRAVVRQSSATPVMYAATEGDAGFYKSSNTGANWSARNSGLGCRNVMGIAFVGTNPLVWTNCGANSGLYFSPDGGESWIRNANNLPDDFRARALIFGGGSDVYVAGNYGVYKSTNSVFAPFAPANGTFPNTLPVGTDILAIQRLTSPITILLTHPEGNGVFYSTDNGDNWYQASGLPAASKSFINNFLQFQGALYWPIDGAGLYTSTNGGQNWSPAAPFGNLPTALLTSLGNDPNNPNILMATTLGGIYQSSGASNNGSNYTWTKLSTGLPGGVLAAASHPTDPNTILAVGETVYKSTDGGATWSASDTGLAGTTAYNRGASIAAHASAPDNFYVSTASQGIFKSTNAGASWFVVNGGLTGKRLPKSFRIANSDVNTLYAAADCSGGGQPGGVYKRISPPATWTDVTSDLGNKCVMAASIHPTDANTVYASTEGGLYKSTNAGVSWTFKNPGNVSFPVQGVDILPSDPNVLLLRSYHTDNLDRATPVSGVYLSRDGGDSWRQLDSNEKVVQARFVQTPGGRVDAYLASNGYLDEESNGDLAYRCVDVLNGDGFNGANCTRLNVGVGTRAVNRFEFNGSRIAGVATTSGIAGQSYRFLGPDFNNDGIADVLWRQTDGRNFIWNLTTTQNLQNQPATTVNPNTSISVRTVPSPWIVAGLGDFNRDGHSDILWRNPSTGDNYLYLMDNGNIVFEGYLPNVPPAWTVAAVGDFNGDGYADIWWTNTSGGGLNYMYLMGLPSGTLPQVIGQGYMPTVGAPWTIAGTGDFDGNGTSDIWYRNTSTGDNYLYLLNGLAITSQGYTANVPTSWSIAGFGDFNGDGTTDVIWRENTLGYNYLYPMSGLSVLGTAGYLPTVSDTTWTVQGTGDTNKDGISDLLWHQNSTGYNFVWRMVGTQVLSVCGSAVSCLGGVLPVIDESGWSIVNK